MAVRSAAAWVLAMLAVASLTHATVAEDSSPAKPPVQAIWRQREITFAFQSFTTFYSCDSPEKKIKRVLGAVGADRAMDRSTERHSIP